MRGFRRSSAARVGRRRSQLVERLHEHGSPLTLRQSPKNSMRSSSAGGGAGSPKSRSSPWGITATARRRPRLPELARLFSPCTKTTVAARVQAPQHGGREPGGPNSSDPAQRLKGRTLWQTTATVWRRGARREREDRGGGERQREVRPRSLRRRSAPRRAATLTCSQARASRTRDPRAPPEVREPARRQDGRRIGGVSTARIRAAPRAPDSSLSRRREDVDEVPAAGESVGQLNRVVEQPAVHRGHDDRRAHRGDHRSVD